MSSDAEAPNGASIGANTNTIPPSPSGLSDKRSVNGRHIFGFISVMSEDGPAISKVFGIGKKEIKIGRGPGAENDIRINAKQFSRHHCTIRISEDGDGGRLKVLLTNESTQRNATKVLPYVLPHGDSVLLDNPSVFLLQGRRFKWMENCEEFNADSLEKLCGQSVVYLFEESKNQSTVNNVVEHSDQTLRFESKKSLPGSPTSSPKKKRRTSSNVSLQLRKAAHSHSFRSSFQKLILCSPANSIAEEGNETDEESGESKSSPNLISFSPDLAEQAMASLSLNSQQIISSMHNVSGNDNEKSLIDFSSPSPAPPGSPKVISVGMQSPPPSKRNVSVSEESVSVSARTSAASTRQSLRVSGTENKVNPGDIHGSDLPMENQSVLGISALYETVEEGNTTLNSSQVSSTSDAFTPIKNNDPSPRKSIRRSSRLFDGSETPTKDIKTTIDATLHSPAPSGSPKVSSVEMHSPLPRITSLSQEAFAARTSSTPTRQSLRVACMENKDNPDDGNESVLGISALYKTVEEGNTTLNSSQVSSASDSSTSTSSTIKYNDASPRTPIRRSSRLFDGPDSETPNLTASESIIDATSRSPVPSGSHKVSNVEMQSPPPSNVSVSAVSVSGESSATPTRRSLRVSCMRNKEDGNESILGISALYRTVEEENTTLNSPQASPASDSSSSAIKNNETTPQTPIRRSSRLFVGTETPNETATLSPAGSLDITNSEMYSTPCSNVSLSKVSVSARTSAAPARRSLRASGTENKINLGDILRSDFPVEMENESVLGISALYKTDEEGNTTLNSSQASYICSAASPIKNNDTTPRTPIRRSSKLFVGMGTPNHANKSIIDATSHSSAPSGSRDITNVEMHSAPPSNVSLFEDSVSARTPATPTTRQSIRRSGMRNKVSPDITHGPDLCMQNESVLGISALYKTVVEEGNTTLNSSEASSIFDAVIDASHIKNNDTAPRTPIRRSSKLFVGPEETLLNQTANKSIIDATSDYSAPSGSRDITNVEMHSAPPSNVSLFEDSVSARTPATPTTRQSIRRSGIGMRNKVSPDITHGPDLSMQNESVLGISALYKTVVEEGNTTLNSSEASSIFDAVIDASPIKNNDTAPRTPIRRSSKLFVGPEETLNQTANKSIIDATSDYSAPSGSRDITNVEMHSAPPSKNTRSQLNKIPSSEEFNSEPETAIMEENNTEEHIQTTNKTQVEVETSLKQPRTRRVKVAEPQAKVQVVTPKPKRLRKKPGEESEESAEMSEKVSRKKTRSQLNKIPSSEEPHSEPETAITEEENAMEQSKTTKAPVETKSSVKQSRKRKVNVSEPQAEDQVVTPKPKRLGKKTVKESEEAVEMREPVQVIRKKTRSQLNKIPSSEEPHSEPETAITEEENAREQSKTTKAPVETKSSVKQSRRRKVNVSEPQAEDQVVTPKPKRLGKKTVKESEEAVEMREPVQVIRKKTRSQLNKIPSSEEPHSEPETAIMEETKTEEQIKTTKAQVEAEPSVKQSRTLKVKVAQAEVQVDTPKPKRLRKKAVEENEGNVEMSELVEVTEVSRKRTWTRSQLNKIASSEESNNEPELVIPKRKKTREQSKTTNVPVETESSVKQTRTRKVKVTEPKSEGQGVIPKPKRLPKKTVEEVSRKRTRVQLDKIISSEESNDEAGTNKRRLRERK